MGNKQVILQSRRFFSEEFKRTLVKEYEKGQFSILELSRLHQIEGTILYRWVYKYSTYNKKKKMVVEFEDSSTNKLNKMELRIKELERIVGQKQIKIDYLEKMIDLAKDRYDIDLKKNSDTSHSGGSRLIEKT
jgi:transposase